MGAKLLRVDGRIHSPWNGVHEVSTDVVEPADLA
jgi:hypothetical protein